VAAFYRSGSAAGGEHGRTAARLRLFDGCANVSGRGGPVSSTVLVRPEVCRAAAVGINRGAQERAPGGPDDSPGRRLSDLPGGPRLEPSGSQPSTGLETMASAYGCSLTAGGRG